MQSTGSVRQFYISLLMSSCQATGWEGGWLGDQEIGACQEEHN